MSKTNKSILKRLKITKSGKIMKRGVGMNHFKAKKSRSAQMKTSRTRGMESTQKAQVNNYLYH
jgi:ribosomal protein L35